MGPEQNGRKLTQATNSWAISPEGDGMRMRFFSTMSDGRVVASIDMWVANPGLAVGASEGLANAMKEAMKPKSQIVTPSPGLKIVN